MTLAIVMGLALSVAAAAQTTDNGAKGERHGRFGRAGGRGDLGMMGFRNLDLTDAQQAQLKQIHENHRQSIAPLMQEIKAKRQEIQKATADGAFNEALVTQKLIEIAPLEAKMMGEQARIHQESLAVLTPDQKAKLDQQREQSKTRWAERRSSKQQKQQ
jgi:periplasmic protein CpxP/Spy